MQWVVNQLQSLAKALDDLRRDLLFTKQRVRWSEDQIRQASQSTLAAAQAAAAAATPNPDNWHAVGVVTTAISKATDGTHPGSGVVQLWAKFSGGVLSNAADSVTVYSIMQDYGVKVGATVEVDYKLGAWWYSNVDKCANLQS